MELGCKWSTQTQLRLGRLDLIINETNVLSCQSVEQIRLFVCLCWYWVGVRVCFPFAAVSWHCPNVIAQASKSRRSKSSSP